MLQAYSGVAERTHPISSAHCFADHAPALRRAGWAAGDAGEDFPSKLPARPYCCDSFDFGLYRQPRERALGFRYIQYNEPERRRWLLLDLDFVGAAEAYDRANVAVPNYVLENPANGHAQYAYELRTPVTYYGKSHESPITFLRDIERGMIRRLGADKAFAAMTTKNALHPAWRVSRPRSIAHDLGGLAQWLEPADMKAWARGEREAGLGRNVTVFEALRNLAYGAVLRLKAAGAGVAEFRAWLWKCAAEINVASSFAYPLHGAEINGIVKSVSRWVWKHFTPERFSEIQRARGVQGNAVRWSGHTSAAEQAAAEGISRRTLFNRKAREKLLNQKVALSPYQDKGGLGATAAICSTPQPEQGSEAGVTIKGRAGRKRKPGASAPVAGRA